MILWSVQERTWARIRTDFRMRHADNSYRWFELEAASVPNADARAMRCVGLVRDVTDAKRAHERLLHDAVHDSLTGLAQPRAGARPARCRRQSRQDRERRAAERRLHRHRQVQERQRLVRPRRRRQPAAHRRAPPAEPPRAARHARPRRRRPVRHPARHRAEPAGSRRPRRARTPLAARADQDRRAGDRADRLDRHRRLRRRDAEPPRPLQGGRDRHVPRQARRRRPHRDLPPGDARRPRRPRRAGERSAQGAGEEPDQGPLPADHLPADRGAGRLRGAGALGASQARPDEPGRLHPHRRAVGSHRPPRLARAVARRARGRALAARAAARGAAAVRLRQHLEPADLPPEPHPGDPPYPRPQHRAQGLAAPRDHREPGDGEPRAGDRNPRVAARRRRASWRSTTSARDIRRSPICSASRSTPSRSIARWCRRAATAAAPDRRSCARSWRSATSSARASSPKASRRPRTSASCARSTASTRRASTTASRCRIATCCSFSKMVRTAEHKLRPRGLFRAKPKGKQRDKKPAAVAAKGNGAAPHLPPEASGRPPAPPSTLPNSTLRPRPRPSAPMQFNGRTSAQVGPPPPPFLPMHHDEGLRDEPGIPALPPPMPPDFAPGPEQHLPMHQDQVDGFSGSPHHMHQFAPLSPPQFTAPPQFAGPAEHSLLDGAPPPGVLDKALRHRPR